MEQPQNKSIKEPGFPLGEKDLKREAGREGWKEL
jgi:hypothetical protein